MQIDSIEVFHVALPLRRPIQAAGRPFDILETVLLRMETGDLAGWGEASPGNAPLAGEEWAAGVFGCLRDWLAPAVVGQWIESGEQLAQRLAPFRGNRFAKAALDTAWWDLSARRQGLPLYQLLDPQRGAIEVGPTFDRMDSIEDFLSVLTQAFQAGFARVKLKFRPGWDVRMVDFVRKEFPTQTFHVDVEGALTLDHMEMLCRLDDFGLAMIEQPLPPDDLVGHAMVQETIRTPICLDEGITTPAQADMALELKSCRCVNLKPGRVGGLTPAVAIHDACRQNSVACFVGAVPQSAIGARTGLALAAKANCTYPGDFFPSDQFLEQDLAEALLPARDETDGIMRVPLWSEPGLGAEPDPELLAKFCVAQARL
jgi:O-succinylbenzoate synthase